jgi:hypothetical protein
MIDSLTEVVAHSADPTAEIEAWDPDGNGWFPVSGLTYGAGGPVRLYCDSDDEEAPPPVSEISDDREAAEALAKHWTGSGLSSEAAAGFAQAHASLAIASALQDIATHLARIADEQQRTGAPA